MSRNNLREKIKSNEYERLDESTRKKLVTKKVNQNKTIGIIICKKENKYIIEYCSDKRRFARKYELV